VVGPGEPCPDRPNEGGGTAGTCTPGDQIYCNCPIAGQNGAKICNHDGTGFGDCQCTAGDGGGGGTGGGPVGGDCCTAKETAGCADAEVEACVCAGDDYCCNTAWDETCVGEVDQLGCGDCGGTTGSQPLYAPCNKDADCQSGKCPMGFCTKDCVSVTDCATGVAECVTFDGKKQCLPACKVQSDCAPYKCSENACSECGFTHAVDNWPVTVCADWADALELMPDGTECEENEDCNLGHLGKEKVCQAFGVCMTGCYEKKDCPANLTCSSQGAIGSCK
jgi:hypothetical protein